MSLRMAAQQRERERVSKWPIKLRSSVFSESERFCGTDFGSSQGLTTRSKPFEVRVNTGDAGKDSGFVLEYELEEC